MKLLLLAALALSGIQNDFDWHRQQSRLEINQALTNWSRACAAEFGFTAVELQPPAAMQGRIEAQLLLAGPSAIIELSDWTRLITDWRNIPTIVDRASDAMLAALADPAAYARGERLFIDTVMGGFRTFYEGCRRGTRMDFIRANYLTGEGAMPSGSEERLRGMFRDGVEELRRDQHQSTNRAATRRRHRGSR